MVCIISIGKIDKYFIFPIIGGISIIFFTKLFNEELIFTNYPFIFSIISGLSMCIAIIPFLISELMSKKIVKTKEYIEKQKKLRLRKFLFIFIGTLFDFTQSMLNSFFSTQKIFNFWIFDIIIIYLFSYFILKTRLYRHQYLSAIIFLYLIYVYLYSNYNIMIGKLLIYYLTYYLKFFCLLC